MVELSFKVNDNGTIINVKYDSEMTVEKFILDFTKNNTNYQSTDKNIYTFKCNGKFLNSPNFMKKQLKDLIRNEQVVNFVRKKNMTYSNKKKIK
jgi:hypothetical protein